MEISAIHYAKHSFNLLAIVDVTKHGKSSQNGPALERRTVLPGRSMTISTPLRQELDARTDRSHYLGTDSKGREHYCDARYHVVWVVVDDTLVHAESTAVSTWVQYITAHKTVSWKTCTYDDRPFVVWLTHTLKKEGGA